MKFCCGKLQEATVYPVVVHGVGSSFGSVGLLKVLQLLQQLVAETLLKHWEAINSFCFDRRLKASNQQALHLTLLCNDAFYKTFKISCMSWTKYLDMRQKR